MNKEIKMLTDALIGAATEEEKKLFILAYYDGGHLISEEIAEDLKDEANKRNLIALLMGRFTNRAILGEDYTNEFE